MLRSAKEEIMHPYLILVLVAFIAFMGILGVVSLRQSLDEAKAPRKPAMR